MQLVEWKAMQQVPYGCLSLVDNRITRPFGLNDEFKGLAFFRITKGCQFDIFCLGLHVVDNCGINKRYIDVF